MVALSALVCDLDAELVRLGYKASTMIWYRGCWRRLERFFAAHGEQEFSRDLAMMWVDESCDFFAKEQAGTLKQQMFTCSGSRRCWATSRSTGRSCVVTRAASAG